MTDILFHGSYNLLDEEGHKLSKNENIFEPGNYYVAG
jgi:hypothetical protein